MIVMPHDQLPRFTAVASGNFTYDFDFFSHSIRPVRNDKRELRRAVEARTLRSISNVRLPPLETLGKKQLRKIEKVNVIQSASLAYKPKD